MAHSFRGGIHPDPHKETTAGRAIEALPAPPTVQIPMSMHIGVPAEPLVKAGEHVKMGQKIGDTDAFVSVPVHATVSGRGGEGTPTFSWKTGRYVGAAPTFS